MIKTRLKRARCEGCGKKDRVKNMDTIGYLGGPALLAWCKQCVESRIEKAMQNRIPVPGSKSYD